MNDKAIHTTNTGKRVSEQHSRLLANLTTNVECLSILRVFVTKLASCQVLSSVALVV